MVLGLQQHGLLSIQVQPRITSAICVMAVEKKYCLLHQSDQYTKKHPQKQQAILQYLVLLCLQEQVKTNNQSKLNQISSTICLVIRTCKSNQLRNNKYLQLTFRYADAFLPSPRSLIPAHLQKPTSSFCTLLICRLLLPLCVEMVNFPPDVISTSFGLNHLYDATAGLPVATQEKSTFPFSFTVLFWGGVST